jgi:hypothetical protein
VTIRVCFWRDNQSHIDPAITGFIGELNNGRIPANLAAPSKARM